MKCDPYTIHFSHGRYDGRRTVICRVHAGPCEMAQRSGRRFCITVAACGIAHCSHKDVYVEATGRKIALARALSAFTREVRTDVWAKYRALLPPSPPSTRDVAQIRKRWASVEYRNLFVCPDHPEEILVGLHDQGDKWNDLNIVLLRNEAMMTDAFHALAHAPDDIRVLLARIAALEKLTS
jgi:hypothetical protein